MKQSASRSASVSNWTVRCLLCAQHTRMTGVPWRVWMGSCCAYLQQLLVLSLLVGSAAAELAVEQGNVSRTFLVEEAAEGLRLRHAIEQADASPQDSVTFARVLRGQRDRSSAPHV
eukprot:4267522-Prymnesium_polylepis.2